MNLAYRALNGQVRKKLGIRGRKVAEFGAANLEGDLEPHKVETFERRKAELQERIAQLDEEIAVLKAERKATKKHIPFNELPEEARFDLLPNAHDKTLTVRVHPLANESSDETVQHLCTELNATETLFPGTDLRLIYESVSSQNR